MHSPSLHEESPAAHAAEQGFCPAGHAAGLYRVQPLGWAPPAGHFPQLLGQFLANVLLMAESLQPCLKCAMAAPQASPMKPEFALSTHGTTWAQTRGG